jgi:hypothetical protein
MQYCDTPGCHGAHQLAPLLPDGPKPRCANCPNGKHGVDGATGWDDVASCIDCAAGKFYHAGGGEEATTSCKNCLTGRYSAAEGAPRCARLRRRLSGRAADTQRPWGARAGYAGKPDDSMRIKSCTACPHGRRGNAEGAAQGSSSPSGRAWRLVIASDRQ